MVCHCLGRGGAASLRDALEHGKLAARRSFPRKRESSPQPLAHLLPTDWIPAFAGMTCEPQHASGYLIHYPTAIIVDYVTMDLGQYLEIRG